MDNSWDTLNLSFSESLIYYSIIISQQMLSPMEEMLFWLQRSKGFLFAVIIWEEGVLADVISKS